MHINASAANHPPPTFPRTPSFVWRRSVARRDTKQLRSLPCQHAFHAGCITPWLTQRQRTCPMCKDPIAIRPAPGTSPGHAPSSSIPSSPSAVLSAPLVPQETATPSIVGGDRAAGRVNEGDGDGVGDGVGVGGDRLPLLFNSRGVASGGGSIQETSPV